MKVRLFLDQLKRTIEKQQLNGASPMSLHNEQKACKQKPLTIMLMIVSADQKTDNMERAQQQWRTLSGRWIKHSIAEEIETTLTNEIANGNELKVCIGTDSQVGGKLTEFATVIVFIRKGKGGFMYIRNETSSQKMSIKERMLIEVGKSIEVAYGLCNIFSRYSVDMEVHADINTNPNFKSNVALKEAMGYIMGMGFVFKAKPDAFASSSCANKMVQ